MKKLFLLIAAISFTMFILPLRAQAQIPQSDEVHISEIRQDSEGEYYFIVSGGGYVSSPRLRGTYSNPSRTWGMGSFWVVWPGNRVQSNHSNRNLLHSATACNTSHCLRNPVTGWRAPSTTGQARAEVITSLGGNRAYWNVLCPANTPQGDAC